MPDTVPAPKAKRGLAAVGPRPDAVQSQLRAGLRDIEGVLECGGLYYELCVWTDSKPVRMEESSFRNPAHSPRPLIHMDMHTPLPHRRRRHRPAASVAHGPGGAGARDAAFC